MLLQMFHRCLSRCLTCVFTDVLQVFLQMFYRHLTCVFSGVLQVFTRFTDVFTHRFTDVLSVLLQVCSKKHFLEFKVISFSNILQNKEKVTWCFRCFNHTDEIHIDFNYIIIDIIRCQLHVK